MLEGNNPDIVAEFVLLVRSVPVPGMNPNVSYSNRYSIAPPTLVHDRVDELEVILFSVKDVGAWQYGVGKTDTE